ncbi:FecCD family ABC transporter permease [Ottowia flava]|uniref:FecCD family ABC transporter permease n=1 Tax=Ottowia flava TaxID=2675430 RepID=A0ABW4KTQ9_9BURK|nr:iron ABC transporter permease [Ottowia sp. GY511]
MLLSLMLGATHYGWRQVAAALLAFDDADYDQSVIVLQRLPRALMAMFAGAATACAGAVLQAMLRNPLASPSLLGVSSGAAMCVLLVAAALPGAIDWQGLAAMAGGCLGLLASMAVARWVGSVDGNGRGLSLVLAGALVSMFCTAIANALMLTDPQRRDAFMHWLLGNINHVYADRLAQFWPLGCAGMMLLLVLARPLTLLSLGEDKAAAAGVNVPLLSRLALLGVALACSAAVAVCGPLGFVGLAVPHMVRPVMGAALTRLLPGCMLSGALVCLLADMAARTVFAPHALHTGVLLELCGGLAFIAIVRRIYVARPA